MTIFTSQMISGMIGQQIGMFQGYGGYAQGFGPGGGMSGMGPSPFAAMPPPTSLMTTRPGQWGMYGEQAAMRMANFGRTAGSVGGVGLGVMGNLAGIPMDPLSGAMMGAMGGSVFGGGIAGAAGGALAGTGIGLGIYGAGRVASAYANAFTGGMNDQAVTNSTLRNNFNFYGGGGAFGRGFGQNQMGQIGNMLSAEVGRTRGGTNMGELTGLVAGGADAGMFTGTRDVQAFTQNFRRMLDTLRGVQRELGGTLTEALQFVRSSQQAGIFQNADRVNFAAEIRTAEAVTGMDRTQLTALAAAGSNISRQYGGMGRQGAMGAVRMAQTLGSAVSSGAINQEMLSEATGGLTGTDALSAFTTNMMERSGRFSRRAMGRYSIFAMSNERGNGLDEEMLDRFRSGDLSVGEVSRAAHRRVGGMGRARALNREGELRGAVMEEGGLSAQIGMMRLMVGDRVMDAGDDLGSLVMQRRFGMSRAESGVMMSLMRNQESIASEENISRMASARETATRNDITQNRSFDAFMTHLEHGLSDATGLTAARDMGRRFMTRISSAVERAGNAVLGVAEDHLSRADRASIARIATGRGSAEDIRRMSFEMSGSGAAAAGGGGGTSMAESMGRRSLADSALGIFGIHTRATGAEVLQSEGVDIRGMSDAEVQEQTHLSRMARAGVVYGADREALGGLMEDRAGSLAALGNARMRARRTGGSWLDALGSGVNRRGMLAFAASEGSTALTEEGGVPDSMVGEGLGAALAGGMDELLGTSRYDRTLDFIARGGHLGADLRERTRTRTEYEAGSEDVGETRGPGGRTGRPRGRRVTGGGTEEERARLADLEGVDRAAVESVVGSEDFADRVMRMSAMEGNAEAIRAEITAGRAEVERTMSGAEHDAAVALYNQMERNVTEFGAIGTEVEEAVRGRGSAERGKAARREMGRVSGNYAILGNALAGGAEGSLRARLASTAGGAREAFARLSSGEGTEADLEAADAASRSMVTTMATFDRSTAAGEREYAETLRSMRATGEGEGATAEEMRSMVSGLSMAAGREAHLRRSLSGRGRRGRAETVDTLLSEATGGTFGSMEFRMGDETISGSRARRMLAEGGENRDLILAQMETQLSERAGGRDMSAVSGTIRESLDALGRGRGLEGEALERALRVGETEGLSDVRASATEDSLEAARAANPLDRERNEILTGIRERLDPAARRRELTELGNQIVRGVEVAIPPPEGEAMPPGAPP